MIKRKGDKLFIKWEIMITHLIVGLMKQHQYLKRVIFPNHLVSKNKIKAELDLSNYVTTCDLKGAAGIYAPKFAKKLI